MRACIARRPRRRAAAGACASLRTANAQMRTRSRSPIPEVGAQQDVVSSNNAARVRRRLRRERLAAADSARRIYSVHEIHYDKLIYSNDHFKAAGRRPWGTQAGESNTLSIYTI